jgi:DNA-binding transcriptional regulator YdaS (Cro superfamily)
MIVCMDIIAYRKAKNLSQAAFAALLTDFGSPATQTLVSQWESEKTAITAERAVEIEKATAGEIQRAELRPDLWDAAALSTGSAS